MVLSLVTMFTEQAFAVPTTVVHEDNSKACDTLVVPSLVDELGNKPAFPDDEWIVSLSSSTDTDACLPISSNNVLVSITNNSPFDFSDLWYVIDEDGSMSNFDGTVGGRRAFKIDSVGLNQPLVNEVGGVVAGVFESGETWSFVLDGYIHIRGESASNFGTRGVPSGVQDVSDLSTGNIIAIHKAEIVGGTMLPIDTTSLMLYYIQGTAAWMIPAILAALGIVIVLARKF